jgi:tRNA (Thr-GGU) A37 N-methylase
LTVVRLLERRDNTLVVEGLDAIDGTPVLDVGPDPES